MLCTYYRFYPHSLTKTRLRTDTACTVDAYLKAFVFLFQTVYLCSNVCFSAYKFTSNYDTDDCDQCPIKYQKLEEEKVQHVIHYGGKTKKFCQSACQNVFVMQVM